MIISKTPFRISLFGGSTDYESFYSQYDSLIIGFCMDKYCYTCVRKTPSIFNHTSKISYSLTEIVSENRDIKHNGVRGVLEYLDIREGIEISHLSDLPSQTGIGSSSSFIVGLLKCIYEAKGEVVSKEDIAKSAIFIERKLLNEPGGIQDQIWASYGGMNSIHINKNGSFEVKPLPVSDHFLSKFFDRTILIHTGKTRQSYSIANAHNNKSAISHKIKIANISHLGYDKFIQGDIEGVATLLHKSWVEKQKISPLISNNNITKAYSKLQKDGMIGGKLLGSGGQGFIFGILKSSKDQVNMQKKYKKNYVPIKLDEHGSMIIYK